jgi:hypothetical protein
MRWTSLHRLVKDYCLLPSTGQTNPAHHPALRLDLPSPASLPGDLAETEIASWETAWIDLGGEG